jgi:hypothetical protein
MDEPDDAEELLRWIDANHIPVGAGGMQLERDAAAEAAAALAQGAAYVAPVNATVDDLKTAFTNQFPMTGMQDNAEDNLDKCKQKSDINSHIRTYNRWLIRSGKIPNGTDVALQAITSRFDKMKFVKVCSKNVHQMITDEFGEVESMRTHLLRRLHQLANLLLVQTAARNYQTNELNPLAVSAGVPKAAYWLKGDTGPKAKSMVQSKGSKAKSTAAAVMQEQYDTECLLV